MKTYEEMANSVFEKIKQRKKERAAMLKTVSAAAACVGIFSLCGIIIFGGGSSQKPDPTPLQDDAPITTELDIIDRVENDPADDPLTAAENQNNDSRLEIDYSNDLLFNLNEIAGAAGAAEKYYDPATHTFVKWTDAEMREYLGVDMSIIPKLMPSGWEMKREHNNGFELVYDRSGTLVRDRACYFFGGKDGRSIIILASRLGQPYDCVYTFQSKVPTLYATPKGEVLEVIIGGMNRCDDRMEYEKYVADFEHNGVYYRVVSEKVESFRVYTVIRALIGDLEE